MKHVEFLLKKRLSYRKIKQETGVGVCKISKIKQKIVSCGNSIIPKPRNGRSKKMDNRCKRTLIRLIVSGKHSTATGIQESIESDSSLPLLSILTFKRALYSSEFRGRAKIKKPYLKKYIGKLVFNSLEPI